MRTKKTFINLLTDVLPLLVISFLGIFKFKLFLNVLGDETLGLYQLFTQIMVYVALVDGGLSSAVLYSLYKPNTDGDQKKFNAILAGAYNTFSKIGMIVFGIATIVSFFIPLFIKNCSFGYGYVIITFLLFSLNNVIGYYFVPYNCLLEVKERKYIYNIIAQGGQILLSIVEIVMLLLGTTFWAILIVLGVIRLLSSLLEMYICKREYPEIKLTQKERDYSFKKHIGSLLFHKVNGLVGSNIDTILISSILGLEGVAIYSTYNYIINMLKKILGKLSSSMTAIVGNYLSSTKDKVYELYMEFNSMLFYIGIIICTPLILAIDDFIILFYDGKIATSSLIAISFVSILFIFIIKMATNLFITAQGLYKETRYCALTDTIINLLLSLILIYAIGIPGVLIATAISVFIAEYIFKTIVVHKYVFHVSSKYYFMKNIKFFILFIIDVILGYYIINLFTINTIVSWLIIFIIYTIINGMIILLIFHLFKETKFINRIKILLERSKK